ncbi:MAG TPA: Ig-like domain-containing protein [Gemmatimonadaceae bacterium]|nr:Ig-like domain-containing protein [Gemmatimonadaceae bacterium]
MNTKRMRGLASPMFAFALVAMAFAGCGELTGPKSPSTPTNVTATLLPGGVSVRVNWTPSPQNDGVVSYNIFRNGVKVGESTGNSFTDTGLAPQQNYKYTVSANCTSGVISDASPETAAATVTTLDITPPTVATHQPPTGFQGVSPGATVTATFSEPMDPATINTTTFNLKVSATGVLIPGTVTFTPATRLAEFRPTNPLPNPANITATVTTGAKDLAGNGLAADVAWGFTTADQSPPTVTISPANGATVAPSVIFVLTFSENMDATTINGTNITLKVTSSGAAVAGNVNYNTTTHIASFTPLQTLAQSTQYTLTVAGTVKDAAGNLMGTPVSVTVFTSDVTAPTVLSTVPADGATGVSTTAPITATFSEPMDISSINGTTFTLKTTSGGTPVAGTVTFNNSTSTATFAPSSALSSTTSYTATITTGVRDVSSNNMAANKVWTFTTADVAAPSVSSVAPTDGALGVSIATNVQVTFSEPMASASITTSTFTLKNTLTGIVVPASVSYNTATSVATLTPTAVLAGNSNYTVTVTTGVTDASGNPMAAPFNSVFTTELLDTTAPTVTSVSPPDGSTTAATTTAIQIAFSEPMNPTTITTTTVSLKNAGTGANITSTVVYNAGTNSVTLTPSGPLSNSTQYTVTVTTGVKDVAGNQLAAPFVSSFTTVPLPDNTAPTIITRSPANGATGVATNSAVTIQFSEPMDQATINTTNIRLSVTSPSSPVAGTVAYNASTNTATFTPDAPLANNTGYTVTTTGLKDVAGNSLAAQPAWTFTTIADTTAPTILSTSPNHNATGIAVNSAVTVTFSEAMDAATIVSPATNIKLNVFAGGAAVAGNVSYNASSHVATFTPTSNLTANTKYTATVTTGVKDAAGNPLAVNATFDFTTAP